MSGADLLTRKDHAAEHLQLLQSLASEVERAMAAIVDNNISDLEDSIAQQQALSLRLSVLAEKQNEFRLAERSSPVPPADAVESALATQIRAAASAVQSLNLRYSMLLQHASRSVAMMVSLFRSFQGEMQEGAGSRLHHATWSCQV